MLRRGRLRRRRPPVRRSNVSGIPFFWAEAPAPFTATLVFRVGRSDETLPTGGITHLAEHILMPASPPRDVERNARVEDVFAVFWATGNPTRVLRFLDGLAALIQEPPLDRLETERSILRTEAAGGGADPASAATALRYGARGHGLIGYEEYGLHTVGADDVRSWVGRYFTRDNAALWMTAPPPRGFRLALPGGTRMPPPDPEPLADLEFPLVHPAGPDDTVVVAFDAHRSAALAMASAVLVDRAWQQIRYDRGLAYAVGDYFEALTADVVHETIWIESLTENVDAVRDTLLGLIEDLADSGATEAELAAELERIREDFDEPSELPPFLHFCACEHLLGHEVSEEDFLARRERVTPEATAEAMRPVLDRLLVAVPSEEQAPPGYALYPLFSSDGIEGRIHRPMALPISRAVRRSALVVGDEGVTMVGADTTTATVRFRDVAALLRWPDGGRTIWSVDGTQLHIDPELWRKGREAVAAVDAAIPEDLVVRVEPDVVLRHELVERVAAEKLNRRWVVSDELKLLPEALDVHEELLTLAEANRGLRSGLLAATSRRLLWLHKLWSEQRLDVPYEDISDVRVHKKRFLETKLELETSDGSLSFTELSPKERLDELEALIRERLGARQHA